MRPRWQCISQWAEETIDWIPEDYKAFLEKQGVSELDERMRLLNARLQQQGFSVLRSCGPSSSGNPTLVASRLPILYKETLSLAPSEAEERGMKAPRSAAYVEVQLAPEA